MLKLPKIEPWLRPVGFGFSTVCVLMGMFLLVPLLLEKYSKAECVHRQSGVETYWSCRCKSGRVFKFDTIPERTDICKETER